MNSNRLTITGISDVKTVTDQPIHSQRELFQADTTWFHVLRSMIETGDIARMGAYAVTVYLVIKSHANFKTGRSFPAIETVVRESGISRSQVIRELRTLEKFGYITKTRRGRHNEYKLREKVSIQDGDGRPTAVATWDYLPSTVQAAAADLKNVLVSGDFSGSRIVRIDRLQVNVTHASGNAVVFNAQDVECLPKEMRDVLMSLHAKLQQEKTEQVVHSSV
ncbi:helix-turn-helix domain-containing protein [Herbaspirillum sp. RTI4]|uniref:helix-turn-helix domain-containing protein n=1 Tax=Herbaspirillum sp. RTI4 TaxID=3048640 RepID=UPI002AB37B43|nr:helix-turn-helix domain-containing protein [Herbaspirillum sp. RTI4]MDY7579291.1 helix-turn-helix domain-containing protein [Herbaspirillum sp. RTI4]MEA9982790.1 helix-turn-helix domain-containing protein [Herbaspirillum sp. RTI4]